MNLPVNPLVDPPESSTDGTRPYSWLHDTFGLIANTVTILTSALILSIVYVVQSSLTEKVVLTLMNWSITGYVYITLFTLPLIYIERRTSDRAVASLYHWKSITFGVLFLFLLSFSVWIFNPYLVTLYFAYCLWLFFFVYLPRDESTTPNREIRTISTLRWEVVLGLVVLVPIVLSIPTKWMWGSIDTPLSLDNKSSIEKTIIRENDLVGKTGKELQEALEKFYAPDGEITLETYPGAAIAYHEASRMSTNTANLTLFFKTCEAIYKENAGRKSKDVKGEKSEDIFLPIDEIPKAITSVALPKEFSSTYCNFQSINSYYKYSPPNDKTYGKTVPRHTILLANDNTEAITLTRNNWRWRSPRRKWLERLERAFGRLGKLPEGGATQEKYERSEWVPIIGQEYQVWRFQYEPTSGDWQIAEFHGGLSKEKATAWYKFLKQGKEWHNLYEPTSSS